ncbi:MAG: phospholipid carrier-dependent glycosyltransferase, partial [Acidimicrobiales bacterium]|nr:phospholipid carrier-dependent glycosyltransferase [Acidimicrobiales bacterium]
MLKVPRVTPARLATFGAIVLALGLGLYQALVTAPWRHPDEWAHTGYAMSLSRGELPSISTPIEVPRGAADLQAILDAQRAENLRLGTTPRDTVWVANHPPGPYLASLPGTWLGRATDHGYLVIGSLRAANVVAFAAAAGFTGLLARRITGNPWAGALAAALFATSPYLSRSSALAMTDGFALAAILAACWAATLALERDFDRRSTLVAATAAAACGMSRLTSLVTAVAVLGAALALVSLRRRQVRWREALAVAGPVTILSGWFYALNIVRYGDPAASEYLLDRFERSPTGSLLDVATDVDVFGRTLRTLAAGRVDRSFSDPASSPWSEPGLSAVIVLVIVGLAAAVVVGTAAWQRWTRGRITDGAGWVRWVPLAVALVANWLMMAQHVSGGGQPHSRYLAMAVPAGAIVV